MEEKERLEFVRALLQTAVLDSRRESESLVAGDCSPARTMLFVADFEGSHVLGGPDGTPLEAGRLRFGGAVCQDRQALLLWGMVKKEQEEIGRG